MKVRSYAIVLLLLAGIVPLLAFAYVSITESERATIREARRTNALLAQSTAARVGDYVDHETEHVATVGAAIILAAPENATHIAEAALIDHTHWHNLTVVNAAGETQSSAPPAGYMPPAIDAKAALEGHVTLSKVRQAEAGRDGPFTHSLSMAIPLYVVGSLRGAVLVDIDLVNFWVPINATRIGRRGFVRLLTADGTVLAHGHPEDRRDVFAGQQRPAILEQARRGDNIVNSLGETAITALAPVEGTDWSVVVEQPITEAYAAARRMRSYLLLLIAITVFAVIAIGLWAGRGLVKSLETMEAHTKTLATGDLSKEVAVASRLREFESLASSINTMAFSLETLHAEARNKDRITTFGRVAAGLAHDIRQPVETMQVASNELLQNPSEEKSLKFFRWTMENEFPRLRRYLDDLRQLAAEGDVGLHLSRVSPSSLIQDLTLTLSAAPKWQGVEFVATGEARDFDADESLLSRAIFNLAGNAADATVRKGGGTVTIGIADIENDDKDGNGSALRISVEDDGCGMSTEALADVLKGDFQSTKRANGVGLGFGVARHIALSHGGSIDGVSEEDVGTTFTIVVPHR